MMTASAYGALVGLFIAAVDFLLLRALSRRVDLPETKRVLQITGLSQFFLLPIIGWFAAPFFVGE